MVPIYLYDYSLLKANEVRYTITHRFLPIKSLATNAFTP